MTLDGMKLAVASKLPELIESRNGLFYWREAGRVISIRWPTEGLVVCHEAVNTMNAKERAEYRIHLRAICAAATKSTEECLDKCAIDATYEQRLEALCRVWHPERFEK